MTRRSPLMRKIFSVPKVIKMIFKGLQHQSIKEENPTKLIVVLILRNFISIHFVGRAEKFGKILMVRFSSNLGLQSENDSLSFIDEENTMFLMVRLFFEREY